MKKFSKYWYFFVVLISLLLSYFYLEQAFGPGIPPGRDVAHYYTTLIKYAQSIRKYGTLPNWFFDWYGGYPESTFNTFPVILGSYLIAFGLSSHFVFIFFELISFILLGILVACFSYILTKSKISSLFSCFLILTSIPILKNMIIDGRFLTVLALPLMVLSLLLYELFLDKKKINFWLIAFSIGITFWMHLMTAYILLLIMFLRTIVEAIDKKDIKCAINFILVLFFSFLIGLIPLIKILIWQNFGSISQIFESYSPGKILTMLFSFSPGINRADHGIIQLTIFIGFLCITIWKPQKKKIYIALAAVLLFILYFGPYSFLWQLLPFHSSIEPLRLVVYNAIFISIGGGIFLSEMFSYKKFYPFLSLFVLLLCILSFAETLHLPDQSKPIKLNEGMKLALDFINNDKEWFRVFSTGFGHHYAYLIPVEGNHSVVGGWFYQGNMIPEYVYPLKNFGKSKIEPSFSVKYAVPFNPTLFNNLLWWFGVKYVVLGYNWFEKNISEELLQRVKPYTLSFIGRARFVEPEPLQSSKIKNLEILLKQNKEYFTPIKIYKDVNLYQYRGFDNALSFRVDKPILFIGPRDAYQKLFFALEIVNFSHIVLVKGPDKLDDLDFEIFKNFDKIVVYGIPIDEKVYNIAKILNKKVILIVSYNTLTEKMFKEIELNDGEYGFLSWGSKSEKILLKYFKDKWPFQTLKKGKVISTLNGNPIIVNLDNITWCGFDLPLHIYLYQNDYEANLLHNLMGKTQIIYDVQSSICNDEIRLNITQPGWIFIRVAYHPDWKGENIIFKAGPDFMLTYVEKNTTLKFIPSLIKLPVTKEEKVEIALYSKDEQANWNYNKTRKCKPWFDERGIITDNCWCYSKTSVYRTINIIPGKIRITVEACAENAGYDGVIGYFYFDERKEKIFIPSNSCVKKSFIVGFVGGKHTFRLESGEYGMCKDEWIIWKSIIIQKV